MRLQSLGRKCVAILVALLLVMTCSICVMAASDNEKYDFTLDMQASVNAEDSNYLDLVITVKDIVYELDAVEFVLNFDQNKVAGVITDAGAAMDAFITTAPMYNLSIAGVEVPVPRYEQICTYNREKGIYMCRFLDKLTYPGEKPGQKYHGLIRDGELVITIQFRLLDGVSSEETVSFSATNVKGTTRSTLKSVRGQDATVAINGDGKPHVHTWTDANCEAPKTCADCGLSEGNKTSHKGVDEDGFCDHCQRDVSYDEGGAESPDTGDYDVRLIQSVLLIALAGLSALVLLWTAKYTRKVR